MPARPKLVARAVTDSDVEEHFRLMCASFQLDESMARGIYYSDPFFETSHKRVLVDEATGQYLSGLTLVPSTIRLANGALAPVAGLAGVGTPPSLRGRGYAGALIAQTLRTIPAEFGYSLAALVTDRPDYYRQFGFETASSGVRWRISRGRLPQHASGREVKLLTAQEMREQADDIHELYRRAVAQRAGSFTRDPRRWAAIEALTPDRRVAALREGDRLTAYVAYHETSDSETPTVDVHEMVADSHGGRVALVAYLALMSDTAMVTGTMSRRDFAAYKLDKLIGMEADSYDAAMMRVTDLDEVIASVAKTGFYTEKLREAGMGLTIRIDNATLPRQQKPVRLFSVQDHTRTERVALAPADELEGHWIAGEIGCLTQMLVGFHSPGALHASGRLRASSSDAVALADSLFPEFDPFLAGPDSF